MKSADNKDELILNLQEKIKQINLENVQMKKEIKSIKAQSNTQSNTTKLKQITLDKSMFLLIILVRKILIIYLMII